MSKLFEPTEISFRIAYPELKEYEQFSNLTDSEYAFVWHLGCKDSPIYGFEEKERMSEAFKLVPDFAKKLSKEEFNQYVLGEIPDKIREAITQMNSFEPQIRYKAKIYTDRYLEYANKVTTMDIEVYMSNETIAQLKTFMDLQTTIATTLPKIVRSAEQGFGFVSKGKEKESQDDYKVLENI